MSHAEILVELPKLTQEERQDVLNHLWKLQEHDLLTGNGPSDAEKRLLDQELEDYERDKESGTPWREVIAELRARGQR
jgi:ribosome recycling factor